MGEMVVTTPCTLAFMGLGDEGMLEKSSKSVGPGLLLGDAIVEGRPRDYGFESPFHVLQSVKC